LAYPTEGLPVFLEHVALIQSADDLDRDAVSVKCLTSHSAKGLEFPIVFVAGLEDGLFPHSRSYNDPAGLEEERRLVYVSITRAMDRLFLSAAYNRSSTFWRSRNSLAGGAMPSRFLAEIPDNLIETNDPESERALKGDILPSTEVPDHYREKVDREYSEKGKDWVVLPGAYKYAEAQGGLAKARVDRRRGHLEDDMPREPSKYAVGQYVKHVKFGEGKIVKIQPAGGGDYFLQINFEEEGAKLLSEQKAPLERVGD
jgi:DNA helicase-2/ATP-dependent DNA helicase PcrA